MHRHKRKQKKKLFEIKIGKVHMRAEKNMKTTLAANVSHSILTMSVYANENKH